MAVAAMVKELKTMSTPIQNKEQIRSIATISANGDQQIGNLLADLFEKVGHQGVITISQSKTLKHEI